MSDTLVLLHGAWAAGWVWDPVLEPLQDAGTHVLAPTLPGQGDGLPSADIHLDRYVQFMIDTIETASTAPVCLVGHSGSGVVVSQVAEARPDLVAALVYVAGFMLPTGMRFPDLCEDVYGPGVEVGASLEVEFDTAQEFVSLRTDKLHDIFFNCVSPEVSAPLIQRLLPHPLPGWTLTNTLSETRFGTVPRHYVRLLRDNSVPLALQDRMFDLMPGAQVHDIDTDHVPQVSAPDRLVETLLACMA